MEVAAELENLIKEYGNKQKKFQDQLETERQEREALDRKTLTSFKDVTNLYQKAQVAQDDEWRSQLQENQERVHHLESSKQSLEEKIQRLENNLQKKKDELRETNAERGELKAEVEQLKSQKNDETTAITQKLREANSSKREVSRTLERLESENLRLQTNMKAMTEKHMKECNGLKNEIHEFKQQTAALEKKLKLTEGREKNLSSELEQRCKLNNDLSAQHATLESKNGHLSQENSQLQENLRKLDKEWTQKLREVEEQRNQVVTEKTRLEERMKRKEKNVQERLQELETSNSQLAMEKRRLEKEGRGREVEFHTAIESLQAELSRAKTKTKKCEEMMMSQEQHLKEEVEEAENRRSKVLSENDQLRDRIKEVTHEAEKRVQELEREKQQLEMGMGKLRREMNEKDQESGNLIKRLELDVANYHVEREELVQSCEAKEPVIEEKTQKIREQETTISMLQERIKALDKQLSETIAGKHNQLYKERKEMKKAEEEKLSELLAANVSLEATVHQLEMDLKKVKLQKDTAERKLTQQTEAMQQMKVSNEKECKNLKKSEKEKLHQTKELLLEKCNLEEQMKSLEKNMNEMQDKVNKREFEIREVMVKNMDLRTDLKRSKNKSNNETVLCRAELRETKRKLRDAEEALEAVTDSEEKYKERMKELQAEYSESEQKLMDEVQTLQESNRQVKLMMEETQSDRNVGMGQLMTQLDEAKQMIGDKEEALEKMKRLEMEAQERIIEIEDAREKDKRQAKKEMSNLMEKLDETKAELQRFKQSMSSETGTLQAELEEEHRKLEMCECTIRELREVEQQLRSKVRSLESLERHAKEDEEEVNELKEQNEALHARLASQASENTTKLASLERSLHVVKVEKAELESELETMTEASERLQTQAYSLQTENERIRELQEKNSSLQTKLNSMKESNRKEVSDLEEILQQTRKARQDLENEMDGLKNSEVRLNQKVARLEQDLDDKEHMYKTQVARLQEQNEALHARLASQASENTTKLASVERALHVIKVEKAELESELETMTEANERLQTQTYSLQTENERIRELQEKNSSLQSKLNSMKESNRKEVSDLEEILQQTRKARQDLEKEMDGLKNSEVRLNQRVARLEQDLDDKEQMYKTQIARLQDENKTLHSSLKSSKGQSSSEVALLKLEIDTLHQEGQRSEQARQDMESEIENLRVSEAQLKREMADLKEEKDSVVRKFEDEITCVKEENRDLKVACENVQGQSSSEVAILRSELKTLKRREEEKESSYEQLKVSEQKLKKQLVEADMNKAKEDDRWQQTVSQLEMENKNLKDELNKEKAVGSVDNKELSDVKGQLVALQGKYQSLEEKEMSLMKRLREAEGNLNKEKESHNKETRIFSMDLAKLKKEVESLTKENKSLISERCAIQAKASDLSEASREKEEMQNMARGLEEDLKQTSEERGNMERMLAEEREASAKQEKTISDLRSTCSMLEEQVADLENLSDRLEQNLCESLEKSQKLEKELEGEKERSESMAKKIEKDLEAERMKLVSTLEAREADSKQKMNEEREAFKEAQKQQEEEREELNGDIQHWKEQSENYREQALKLAQQLAEMQANGAKLEKDLRTLREKFAAERKDSDNLTSELASILDKFEETKATNYKLTTCLEKAIEKGEELKDAKSNLETEKDALNNQYSVEKIKLTGMMSQQTKLIDFLQAKVADPPKKKKRRLFGKSGKEKQTPESNMLLPVQYKELQEMLDYEMSKNVGLEKILEETRRELQAVKSATLKSQSSNSSSYLSLSSDISMSSALSDASTVLSAIVLSPTNQPSRDSLPTPVKGPFTRSKRKNIAQNARASKRIKERMKHNIPHRFANILNMKPTKCAVCVDTVHFGRHASKCQECNLVCHPKCASALPHTCGLPFQFVRHFSEALHHQTDSPVTTFNSSTETSVLMRSQGWMKVRGSVELNWVKKWVTLDGPQLLLFDREHLKETSKPSKTFDLQPKEGWVSIHAGITPAELPNTVPSDIPFVVRLEHHMPSQSYFPAGDNVLYLMAPTFPEKQRWVAVLENVVALNGFGAAEVKRQTASIHSNTILSLENDNKLDINCTLVLDEELLLVGCDEGLFVMNLKKFSNPLAQLLGVGSMYQMKYVPQLVSVIIIAGELRKLGFVEAPHLIVQARDAPKKDTYIKCTSIASIEDCHLFAIEEINSAIYLCAAQPQKISILKYNYDSKQFVIKKELPTAETCSCLLFSQTGKLLAGMDRFYQVELNHYQSDEFLDSNDPSLAHAINSTSDMNSFPVAALQVAAPESQEEFLLCFHEFALFVDANGHRTREEDLEWSRLPLSVTFREPYLFITHFNCLEVLEIKPFAQKDLPGAHTFVEMPIPRFVGFAISEGAIYVTSSNSQKVELICILGNLIDTMSDEDNHDTTITMDTSEETPKTARTSSHVIRRSSRVSLKRNLEEVTDSSNPKLSRTLSGASSRSNTSFRAAVASSGLRRSTRLAGTSSSEDEVNRPCGSLKMLSKGSRRSKAGQ